MSRYLYKILKNLWFIGIVLSSIIVPAFGTGRLSFEFHDSIIVKDTAIYLADIAALQGDSAELLTKLSGIKVGDAAPPGFSRFVNIDDFMRFHVIPKIQPIDYTANNKHRISVKTDFIERKVVEFQDSIQNYIKQHVTWNDGSWRVEIKNPEMTLRCFNAPFAAEVRGLKSTNPRGQIKLELIVHQGDKKIRIQVPCKIFVSMAVAVATANLPRGKMIDSGDFIMQEIDITNYAPTPFFSADELQGRVIKQSIRQGTVLNTKFLATLPVINKGDPVSIEVQRGGARVAVSAIARENGSIGEKIWVENSATHKLIRVTIKDRNRTVTL
jgi:flagella basal body P-ring formation protein FlgA